MSKKRINENRARVIEPTSSMLNLLDEYYDKKEGLEAKDFRYALQEDYAKAEQIKKDPQVKSNIEKIEKKLNKKRLDKLYKKGLIVKGSIRDRSHLNYYLGVLCELGIIEKNKKIAKITRYKINDNYYNSSFRLKNIETIKMYHKKLIQVVEKNNDKKRKHVLYGISKDFFNSTEEEKIKHHIKKIEKHIIEISKIKENKLENIFQRRIKKIVKDIDDKELKKILKNNKEILELLIEIFYFFRQKNLQPDNAHLSKIWDNWKKHMTTDPSDIKKIIEMMINEFKDNIDDFIQPWIAYSTYNTEIQWMHPAVYGNILSQLFDAFNLKRNTNFGSFYMDLMGITELDLVKDEQREMKNIYEYYNK